MGTGVGGTLPPDKEKAILALLREPTVQKAAEAVDIDESTLYRWLRDTTFATAYRDARREAFRHAIALTQKYAPHAVQALMKILASATSSDSAKVSAATAMLKFSREAIELDDLAARVEELERASKPSEPLRYDKAA
jgi:hypothetical protein